MCVGGWCDGRKGWCVGGWCVVCVWAGVIGGMVCGGMV